MLLQRRLNGAIKQEAAVLRPAPPLPTASRMNSAAQSSPRHISRQRNAPAAAAAAASGSFGQYAKYREANFASLDHVELERLHVQLKSAYCWLDIKSSLEDYSSMMVDEESVVCALIRLATIYSHLGEAEQGEVRSSGLVERLAAMMERRLPALTPKQLISTLDALAALGFKAPASFVKAAKRQTIARMAEFAPAQLPLLVVAFASLGHEPGTQLISALGEALQLQQLEITPEQLSLTLVALAGLSTRPSQSLLKGLVAALRRRLDDFRPAQLAAALQALARLRLHPGEDVMCRIAARAGVTRRPATKQAS